MTIDELILRLKSCSEEIKASIFESVFDKNYSDKVAGGPATQDILNSDPQKISHHPISNASTQEQFRTCQNQHNSINNPENYFSSRNWGKCACLSRSISKFRCS